MKTFPSGFIGIILFSIISVACNSKHEQIEGEFWCDFKKYHFCGHDYIRHYNNYNSASTFHDPDCPCTKLKEKN